ncbi:HAD family hydrolase [Candidatus Woesearchaeota archaeon]|nr:HAD family hydrolase [Candidatus Woesearchaeota archaeon]MBI2661235.1 HAD family hydrolase [Candidatus Woesearchaeota archaeon]
MRKKAARKIKAVLFDLDGVLVDSYGAWYLTYNQTLEYFGFKLISDKKFAMHFGNPVEEDVKRDFIGKTPKEVMRGYELHFGRNAKYVRLMPHTGEVLHELKHKRKMKLGLISNSTRKIVLAVLEHHSIKDYFDIVMTRDDVKRGKPAPDMALKACRALRVRPEEAMLVGDTDNDMIAAKSAGCFAVGYGIRGDINIKDLMKIPGLCTKIENSG